MVEKRYYCEKHPNVAINYGNCALCVQDNLGKLYAKVGGGFTCGIPSYPNKSVRVGVTNNFSAISQYYIEHHHETKQYWIEDNRLDVPTKIEGEFLRMKRYCLDNDYTQEETISALIGLINKYKDNCTCYMCETSRVTA